MQCTVEVRCIVCQLVFCCGKCRWDHEQAVHGLSYDCPICRGNSFLCNPNEINLHFIRHLTREHLPLQCRKCDKIFTEMEDLIYINECVSISELLDKEHGHKDELKNIDEKLDSILEKTQNQMQDNAEVEAVNKSKTAVITPILRRNNLVDYESSGSEDDMAKDDSMKTPHNNNSNRFVSKTPRAKRAATPHINKFLNRKWQVSVEDQDDVTDYNKNGSTSKTTPSRNDNEQIPDTQKEMTTPTSHLPLIAKLAQVVTTSTPTHPANGGWALFPEQGADSPLSEIENTESPGQSIAKEPSKSESEGIPPKLKSIIAPGNRIRLGSQDSTEKQATTQDSVNAEVSSIKTKKVKFAEDTVFEPEPKVKRVLRKPKRMLTPGPQKPKYCTNPRFQALINRFEYQGITMARTPVNNRQKFSEHTPPVGESANIPARAINFKDDSPIVETGNYSKESNELFKTCEESPDGTQVNAINALTTNIAGSLQNCISSVLKSTEEETEIQFKFVITKKKVYKKIADDAVNERPCEIVKFEDGKENIWSSVAKAVKNVFWGEGTSLALTPYRSYESDSSSASKRKSEDMTDPDSSPLNHKRYKYEGRIRGRPPLRRGKTWVSTLRSSHSAEQSLMNELSKNEIINQSF